MKQFYFPVICMCMLKVILGMCRGQGMVTRSANIHMPLSLCKMFSKIEVSSIWQTITSKYHLTSALFKFFGYLSKQDIFSSSFFNFHRVIIIN